MFHNMALYLLTLIFLERKQVITNSFPITIAVIIWYNILQFLLKCISGMHDFGFACLCTPVWLGITALGYTHVGCTFSFCRLLALLPLTNCLLLLKTVDTNMNWIILYPKTNSHIEDPVPLSGDKAFWDAANAKRVWLCTCKDSNRL